MSHYYFKVVPGPDGHWQTRRGARVLAAYSEFQQALTRARVEVNLHRPSELIIEFEDGEQLSSSASGQPPDDWARISLNSSN